MNTQPEPQITSEHEGYIDGLYRKMSLSRHPGQLTEQQVRDALVSICSHPHAMDTILAEAPDCLDCTKDELTVATNLVEAILSEEPGEIIDAVNDDMACHYIVEVRDDDIVQDICKFAQKEAALLPTDAWIALGDMFPMVAGMPTTLVGTYGGNGGGSCGPFLHYSTHETFIANDGSVWVSDTYEFYDDDLDVPVLVIRLPHKLEKDDPIMPSMGFLAQENTLPVGYHELFDAIDGWA